jgi:hypothetical protein
MNEPKIYQRKHYTANTPVARAVSELIEKYGGRLVLEAVADYCVQNLGLRWFAAGFGQAAEQLGSADDHSRPARSAVPYRPKRSQKLGLVT